MALAIRVACNKEGNGDNNEGDGDEGGGQATTSRAMVTTWAMATVMRQKGKGGLQGQW